MIDLGNELSGFAEEPPKPGPRPRGDLVKGGHVPLRDLQASGFNVPPTGVIHSPIPVGQALPTSDLLKKFLTWPNPLLPNDSGFKDVGTIDDDNLTFADDRAWDDADTTDDAVFTFGSDVPVKADCDCGCSFSWHRIGTDVPGIFCDNCDKTCG